MYDSSYYDSGYYSSSSSDAAAGFLAAGILVIFIALIFVAVFYVTTSILLSRIFKKAGLPTWKAWVPYYNTWVFFELGGYNGALSLIAIAGAIPYIGWVASIALFIIACLAAKEISKKMGREENSILFPLGLVSAGITTLVWYILMGSDKNVWNDSLGKPSLAKGTILGYATETVYVEKTEAPFSPANTEVTPVETPVETVQPAAPANENDETVKF